MASRLESWLALRYLRPRREEGFVSLIAGFSLLGIMLGVATLIIVMAVMNGFRHELLGRILGMNGHVIVAGPGGSSLTDYMDLTARLTGIDGVTEVVPVIDGRALMTVGGAAEGVVVRGLSEADYRAKTIVSGNIMRGKPDSFDKDKVIVGKRMADAFSLLPGDTITLVAPRFRATPFGSMPRMRGYEIDAVFETEMYDYDRHYLFMPMATAQVFFEMPDRVSHIELMTENPDHTAKVVKAAMLVAGPLSHVTDWQRTNESFFTALQVERNVMFLILTLIVLVATFNIISSQIMLVKDKSRDIAILRSMGATRLMVMRVFVLTGGAIGMLGTALGAALGIGFALNIESIRRWLEGLTGTDLFRAEIYFLSHLPARIDWGEVAVVIGIAFALSLLATIYPAWRAARLDPVEALRYE
ncbi:MAG: lipoprotein-releasing ABC transporter permease subunit [Pseudomonadota bacterium]|nr:lipoprotein-releasing ABC transporter permease subunit [Pseudomonadota bacterium]